MSALVRSASLTNYHEVALAAGLRPMSLLAEAGLSPAVLRELDLKVPAEQVRQLLELSATAARDESFGLRMAESRQISNLGPVGLLLRDQPTLRDSLVVLLRYHRALNGALSIEFEESGSVAVLREEMIVGEARPVRQSVELALGVLMRLLRQFLGSDWQPRRVCFAHGAPREIGTHLRVFGPGVEFHREFNGIVFARADLDARNPSADVVMARYAQQLLDASMAGPAPTTIEEVRHAIVRLLPGGRCGIQQVSSHLGVAPRTLQRRLASQGGAFSALVNETRVDLATRHLGEGSRPLMEVAGLLGFSEQSAFSRWHREQFGCTPRERRAARH
jgi:AraC-like DNA-binding protein